MYTKTQWVDNTTPINENNLNKIESGIKNNDINIGEENYDNTKTYEVGDIVRYNEKIYKCITAITTSENFDISKWEQTNIVEIVQSEKSKIYELIEAISTPIVGEGENITLNDTAEKRFENFDIEGNSEQETRSGKNKLQNTLESQTINGLTVVVNDDKTIKINGTATANTLLTIGTMTFIANQQYYVSGCPSGGSDSTYRIDFRTSSETVSFTDYGQGGAVSRTEDINLTAKIRIASGATLSNLIFAPMVTEGSTASDYEQYGVSPSPDYPSEVKSCGDNINLFDKDNMTIGKIWSGTTLLDSDVGNASPKIPVKAGKTYIRNAGYSSNYIIKEDNSVVDIQGGTNAITMPENSKYWIFNIPKDIDINTIKAEEGLISTPYSPYGQGCINVIIDNGLETTDANYKSQIYTIPVQKEMLQGDYFDFDNEEEVHVWNKLILDGTESIALNSNYNDCTLFELVKSDCYVVTDTKKYAKSNYFISGNKDLLASNSGSNMVGLGTSKGRIWINISNSIVGTSDKLNNFKTFLKSKYDEGTPVTIYYKLATPQRLKFTDEQKAVAKKLNNARTYKNVTHIYSNDEVSPNCYVEAVKDLTTLIQ